MTTELKLDMDVFTLGEIADLCDAAGMDPAEAMAGNLRLNMQALPAMYWVLRRRSDPNYTLEQARSEGASVLGDIPTLLDKATVGRRGPTEAKTKSKRSPSSATSTPATPSLRSAG